MDIPRLIDSLFTGEKQPGEGGSEMARFMLSPDDNPAVGQLKAIGTPAVPFLVAALAEPRTWDHYRKLSEFLDPRSPFARICKVLEDLHPPAAAAPLAAYLDHPIRGFRERAALTLGGIAAPACVEPLTKALADPDEGVRVYAMMGMDGALKANRGDAGFFAAIFPAIAGNLELPDSLGYAPRLLLQIDRDRALPLLLSPRSLSLENGQLEYVLRALNEIPCPIPHSLLLPLLDQLEPIAGTHPRTNQFGQALAAYANNPDAATEPKLRSLLYSDDSDIGESAAAALTRLHGLGDIFNRIRAIEAEQGFDALSEPRQRYYAVFLYNANVRNGGHVQYLGNFAPRDYRLAVAGLHAIEAPRRAAILEKALEVFGPAGPPEDRERRREIVSDELTPLQGELLETLDQQHFDCRENPEILLALYAVDHKEDFLP